MSRTAAASERNRQFGAERAAKNPDRLAKSFRAVKTAVALETLPFDDLIRETVAELSPTLTPSKRADLAALLLAASRAVAESVAA